MKCPYCNEFKGNSGVKGYPVSEQLHRHIEVTHRGITKPLDKPPLLSEVELQRARKKYERKFHFTLLHEEIPPIIYAQAQRESDIKWYNSQCD